MPHTARPRAHQAKKPRGSDFAAHYKANRARLEMWANLHVLPPLRSVMPVEDFVQETWARAYTAFPSFDPVRGRFRSWLFGIAYKVLCEQLRTLRVRQVARPTVPDGDGAPDTLVDPATSVVSRVSATEQRARLHDAIAALQYSEREIVAWRGLEGLSYAEIGRRLGISAVAAESRWRRALARLNVVEG